MKKLLSLIAVVLISATSFGQSAIELAKQKQELDAILRKILNAKPTKEARKQEKIYKKQGWTVPAGERSIAQQITTSQLLQAELMADEDGNGVSRFIMHTASQVSGSYNTGYAGARNAAQVELAAMLKTEIVAAMQSKMDNSQQSAISAVTVEKFNQRSKSIVDAALTNAIPVLTMYRVLPNNNFEVSTRIAFDKKELSARIKRYMQKELEKEGDELNGIVDEIIMQKLQ